MKVQKITAQPEFQPVTLQITIESQEELDVLKELFSNDFRIPNFLKNAERITKSQESLLADAMLYIHNVF